MADCPIHEFGLVTQLVKIEQLADDELVSRIDSIREDAVKQPLVVSNVDFRFPTQIREMIALIPSGLLRGRTSKATSDLIGIEFRGTHTVDKGGRFNPEEGTISISEQQDVPVYVGMHEVGHAVYDNLPLEVQKKLKSMLSDRSVEWFNARHKKKPEIYPVDVLGTEAFANEFGKIFSELAGESRNSRFTGDFSDTAIRDVILRLLDLDAADDVLKSKVDSLVASNATGARLELEQEWARHGVTNIRTLREALRRGVPLPRLDADKVSSIEAQLSASDERARAKNTTSHLHPPASSESFTGDRPSSRNSGSRESVSTQNINDELLLDVLATVESSADGRSLRQLSDVAEELARGSIDDMIDEIDAEITEADGVGIGDLLARKRALEERYDDLVEAVVAISRGEEPKQSTVSSAPDAGRTSPQPETNSEVVASAVQGSDLVPSDSGIVPSGTGGGGVGPPRGPGGHLAQPGGPVRGSGGDDPELGPAAQPKDSILTRLIERMGRGNYNVELRALTSDMPGVRRLFTRLETPSIRVVGDPNQIGGSVGARNAANRLRVNRTAEQAAHVYYRYLLDLPSGTKLSKPELMKALTEQVKTALGRSEKVTRHEFASLMTLAINRGGKLGTLQEVDPLGRLSSTVGKDLPVHKIEVDDALRKSVEEAAKHFMERYAEALERRKQVGAPTRENFGSPRMWDYNKVHGNEEKIRAEVSRDLVEQARKLWDEGKLDDDQLRQLRLYIDEELDRYILAVGEAPFMRLPLEFTEFIVGERTTRERTFGEVVLGDGLGEVRLEPSFDTLAPYLHLDAFMLLERYRHTQMVDVEMLAEFGEVDAASEIGKIEKAYLERKRRAQERGASAEEITKIVQRGKSDVSDLRKLVDAIRGVDQIPADPYTWEGRLQRVTSGLKHYNFMRIGGGMLFPSLGDASNLSIEHGVNRVVGHIVREWRDGLDVLGKEMSDKDFEFWGITFSDIGQQLSRNLFEVGQYGSLGVTRLERLLAEGGNAMATFNGLRAWTNIAKQAGARAIISHMVDTAEAASKGTADPHSMSTFAAAGITENDLRTIWQMFDQHGGRDAKRAYTWLGISSWDKDALPLAYKIRSAVIRDVERLVTTPGIGDTPFLMRRPDVSLLGQFRRYSFAHTTRVMIPASQALAEGDLKVLNGFGLMFGTAAMGYTLRTMADKREIPEAKRILQEGIVRMDAWGVFGEAESALAAMTGGSASIRGHIAPETYYGNRYFSGDPAGELLGPSLSSVQELGRAARTVIATPTPITATDRDVRALRKIVPFLTVPGLDLFGDAVEEGLAAAHGYDPFAQAKPRDRQLESIR